MERTGNILVIDDDPEMGEACRQALEPHGFHVEVATDGGEGLRKLKEGNFDLVLLDVMMPDVHGMETLERLREYDPDIVCIIITGYATVDLAVQAIKKGAYDFIAKPFDTDTLLLAVNQGLEKRRCSLEAKRLRELEERARRLAWEKEELERLERVKSQFTLLVVHELRAPVAAIQSYLKLILEGYVPPERQMEIIKRAEQRARDQLELISDLLDLARLRDPEVRFPTAPTDVAEPLREVVEMMRTKAEEKHQTLTVNIAPDLPPVIANTDHIRQLWTNLISNAIKYTPNGGRIDVTLVRDGNQVRGAVRDTGIGIPAEHLDRIFDDFFRTDAAKKMAAHGTGLGLSIAKRIVENYGGNISVESIEGQGSTFTFSLPIAEENK